MSETHLLAALKTMTFKGMDQDTLAALKASCDMIVENDSFPGEIQEEAFVAITRIMEAQGEAEAAAGKAAIEAAAAAIAKEEKQKRNRHWREILKDHINDVDEPQGNSENDELVRLMIRSERDGSLSFTFRGIRWNFNHNSNTWDYNKP